MKRLTTLQLIPGMIVADNVLSYDHQLILSRGSILTDRAITRLHLYGITTLFVEDFLASDLDASVTSSGAETLALSMDETILHHADASAMQTAEKTLSYHDRIRASKEFRQFKEEYTRGLEDLKANINNVVERSSKLDVNTLLQDCLSIIEKSKGRVGILDMLYNMREYDDSTFSHCMNVALICNLFATWLKWKREDIETAITCGLLHDIGKLTIPQTILTKPGKLSPEEYDQIKRHPIAGYQLLLSQDVDDRIRYAALMHHERFDGTGYPMHLVGKQIDRYARIVAIADVYDAMTSSRVYRGPMCPFRVIEIFESEGFQKYDVEYLLPFLENVVNGYLQNQCQLSDGRTGSIIYINKDKLSRPVVQCDKEYVNLSEIQDITITNLL